MLSLASDLFGGRRMHLEILDLLGKRRREMVVPQSLLQPSSQSKRRIETNSVRLSANLLAKSTEGVHVLPVEVETTKVSVCEDFFELSRVEIPFVELPISRRGDIGIGNAHDRGSIRF